MGVSDAQVSSIGALLDQLAREQAIGELENEGMGGLEVLGIQALTLYVTTPHVALHVCRNGSLTAMATRQGCRDAYQCGRALVGCSLCAYNECSMRN